MMAFNEDGLIIIATKLGTPSMLDSYISDMCMQSWGRSSYARAMIELRADEELKDTIMVAMSKLTGEGFNLFTIHVGPSKATRGLLVVPKQAEVSREKVSNSNPFDALNSVEDDDNFGSSYARAMIELRADEELKYTIVVAMSKLAGEGFNLCTIRVEHILNECLKKRVSDVVMNNPRKATRGLSVVLKTMIILGMNGGNSKLVGKGSLNVAHGSFSNTPIIDKIYKLECQILDGKLMFVDDDGNLLVPTGNVDNDSEVWRRRQNFLLTSSGLHVNGVTTTCNDVTIADLKNPLEDSTG
ncbi:hypothetical protein Tco_0255427 [Tanacetum coccineum]